MQCDRARDLLGSYRDGELPAAERAAVAEHVATCHSCREILADYERLGRALTVGGRRSLPPGLAGAVRRALDDAEPQPASQQHRWLSLTPDRARTLAARAAVLIIACGLSAGASWMLAGRAVDADRIERDVLNAHVRSLLQDSPVQVASSEQHTVRPWFAGRSDLAPPAKDLAADGFPLLGGRLDYVDGHRTSVLVYKRRLHTINVFMWPAPATAASAARVTTRNGYALLSFTRGGVATWLVSDLNPEELHQLAALL
jgi:anti-sigma factor RsiW